MLTPFLLSSLLALQGVASPEAQAPGPWESRLAAVVPEDYAAEVPFRFSPDGQRLVYVGVDAKGKSVVVLDGEAEKGHDYVNMPVFNADGSHVAWTAGDRAGKKAEKWSAYLDGKKHKTYSWAGAVALDASGKNIAYWAGKGVKLDSNGWYSGGHYFVVHGKKKLERTNSQPPGAPAMSPNGKEVAWSDGQGSRKVIRGKKEYGPYQWVSGLVWSADGKHLAWQVAESSGMPSGAGDSQGGGQPSMPRYRGTIHVDGEEREHDFLTAVSPALGPKGKHLAFIAQEEGGKVLVVHDDEPWESRWDQLGTPVLGPKGKRVAVVANLGMQASTRGMPMLDTRWLDGMEMGDWDEVTGTVKVREPEGECWLVIDDEKVGKAYRRALFPVWGPQGKQVAFRGQVEDGWKLVVGEVESDTFDAVGTPVFRDDGKAVGFGARKGREIHWQVLQIEP